MKEWHIEAKRLRSEGLSVQAICEKLGKTPDLVRWCLDENGQRAKARARARRSRGSMLACEADARRRDKARKAAAALPKRTGLHPAILDYSQGKIDRTEMARRLKEEP